MSETLIIYTRAGCPLCEEMASEVGERIAGTRYTLTSVDVDADPELKARFGWDVPLLFDGKTEICRHELNRPLFRAWLAAHP